jgi:hypothetical protein
MLVMQRQSVRTTLFLDDGVAAKLKAERRQCGEPFKQVVNRLLRAASITGPVEGPPTIQDEGPQLGTSRRTESGRRVGTD